MNLELLDNWSPVSVDDFVSRIVIGFSFHMFCFIVYTCEEFGVLRQTNWIWEHFRRDDEWKRFACLPAAVQNYKSPHVRNNFSENITQISGKGFIERHQWQLYFFYPQKKTYWN